MVDARFTKITWNTCVCLCETVVWETMRRSTACHPFRKKNNNFLLRRERECVDGRRKSSHAIFYTKNGVMAEAVEREVSDTHRQRLRALRLGIPLITFAFLFKRSRSYNFSFCTERARNGQNCRLPPFRWNYWAECIRLLMQSFEMCFFPLLLVLQLLETYQKNIIAICGSVVLELYEL